MVETHADGFQSRKEADIKLPEDRDRAGMSASETMLVEV
jgi:hypothetical protein